MPCFCSFVQRLFFSVSFVLNVSAVSIVRPNARAAAREAAFPCGKRTASIFLSYFEAAPSIRPRTSINVHFHVQTFATVLLRRILAFAVDTVSVDPVAESVGKASILELLAGLLYTQAVAHDTRALHGISAVLDAVIGALMLLAIIVSKDTPNTVRIHVRVAGVRVVIVVVALHVATGG